MPDLQFPGGMGGGGLSGLEGLGIDPQQLLQLLGITQSQQPTSFKQRLLQALPKMIQSGIDGASTPNIGFGGPVDVLRSMQTAGAIGTNRDLAQRNMQRQKVEDLLKIIGQSRQDKLAAERQRHDIATEAAATANNERITNLNADAEQNRHLAETRDSIIKGMRLLKPVNKTLTLDPLQDNPEVPGPPNPNPTVDTLPPSMATPMQLRPPQMTASPEQQLNTGEMVVPSATYDEPGSVRAMPTQEELLRRATEAAKEKTQVKLTAQMLEKPEKPPAEPKGLDAQITDAEAAALNAAWNPVLKKYGVPPNQYSVGMTRGAAADLIKSHNGIVAAAQGGQRVDQGASRQRTNEAHQEYMAAVKDVEKDFTRYKQQKDTLDQAREELSRGDASGQAVGVIKYLSTLASGQGSGVRITQAELNQVIKGRKLGDDFRAWIGKFKEGTILAPDQVRQMQEVLDGVEMLATKKQQVLDSALSDLESATTSEEIRAAKAKLRKTYMGTADTATGGGLKSVGGISVGGDFQGGKVVGIREKK